MPTRQAIARRAGASMRSDGRSRHAVRTDSTPAARSVEYALRKSIQSSAATSEISARPKPGAKAALVRRELRREPREDRVGASELTLRERSAVNRDAIAAQIEQLDHRVERGVDRVEQFCSCQRSTRRRQVAPAAGRRQPIDDDARVEQRALPSPIGRSRPGPCGSARPRAARPALRRARCRRARPARRPRRQRRGPGARTATSWFRRASCARAYTVRSGRGRLPDPPRRSDRRDAGASRSDAASDAAWPEQATALGDRLRWHDCTPTHIWTSPLVRAVQTAELVAAALASKIGVDVQPSLAPGEDLARVCSLRSRHCPTRRT